MAHIRKADVLVVDAEPVARTGPYPFDQLACAPARVRGAETLARAAGALRSPNQPEVLVLDVAIGDAFSFMRICRAGAATRASVVFTGNERRARGANAPSRLARADL